MQMYRARFARKLTTDLVELGDCVVCAPNTDAARDMVAYVLGFAVSAAEFEVVRIKPSLHMISRREMPNSLATAQANTISAAQACSATFPGITESRTEEHWYEVQAQATIRAEDENEAISKLARSIVWEMRGDKQKYSTRDLDIRCDRQEFRPRSPHVEENGLYTHLRFFPGGDGRGK